MDGSKERSLLVNTPKHQLISLPPKDYHIKSNQVELREKEEIQFGDGGHNSTEICLQLSLLKA